MDPSAAPPRQQFQQLLVLGSFADPHDSLERVGPAVHMQQQTITVVYNKFLGSSPGAKRTKLTKLTKLAMRLHVYSIRVGCTNSRLNGHGISEPAKRIR